MFSKLNREVTNKQAALVLNCSAANKKKTALHSQGWFNSGNCSIWGIALKKDEHVIRRQGLCSSAQSDLNMTARNLKIEVLYLSRALGCSHQTLFGFQLTVIGRAAISFIKDILKKSQRRVVSFDWPTTDWRHKPPKDYEYWLNMIGELRLVNKS